MLPCSEARTIRQQRTRHTALPITASASLRAFPSPGNRAQTQLATTTTRAEWVLLLMYYVQ